MPDVLSQVEAGHAEDERVLAGLQQADEDLEELSWGRAYLAKIRQHLSLNYSPWEGILNTKTLSKIFLISLCLF